MAWVGGLWRDEPVWIDGPWLLSSHPYLCGGNRIHQGLVCPGLYASLVVFFMSGATGYMSTALESPPDHGACHRSQGGRRSSEVVGA
ncbi:hypothetical protein [Cutibacterium equinum]|uniref:hypothetical protein n=1 Tax=Cutibacterium equinum TaxID=3016342 RepID=UPI0038CDB416